MRIHAVPGLIILILSAFSQPLNAIPLFARQTGQSCNACHVSFPELTPYGRYFKLTGYTIGQRTLPLSMMAVISRTSTRQNNDANGVAQTPENNKVVLQEISLFTGGKITENIGAFVQWNYDHLARFDDPDPANGVLNFTNRTSHSNLDNTDIRAVGTYVAPGSKEPDLIYGATLHNNPTVQDVWNTAPAWSFPFTSSPTAIGPPAATLIDGALGQQVAGIGGYAFWKKSIYAELSLYRTADRAFSILRAGQDTGPGGVLALHGYNPYWRFAYNREWGAHSLMVGTFGMVANVFPDNTDKSTPTDRFKDVAVDAQYQYITDPHLFTAQATFINEKQSWNASFPVTAATGVGVNGIGPEPANASNKLRTLKAKATYYYQRKYGATLGYFSTTGDSDAGLYADSINADGTPRGSPNTSGYIVELNYVPIQNVRLMAQYTAYRKFLGAADNYDGNGRNARDNNALFLNLWIAF